MLSGRQFLFVALLFLVSCSKQETFVPVTLVSSEDKFGRTASELRLFISLSGINLSTDIIQNDVELYSVTYKTKYLGKSIVASGLVILPKTATPAGMVCFSHGTIASHAEAPSALPLNSTELVFYTALASPGFIAVIPDFIG
ncbi:MAG TPA: hypothetical protein VKQ08_05290, partial [Cyclobacteriaceae bacterium]|nr:hypothetical protein [Cyclobacteriaceae bacterium]